MSGSLRVLLCVALAWLTACSATTPAVRPEPAPPAPAPAPAVVSAPPDGVSRPPTREETRLIKDLMAETERIRGLRFRAPIEVRIQDRVAMRSYVSGAIDEDDLTRARRRYVALGLLDPAVDVRDLLESLMEEELIGYYDPKKKRLAVRDDVARSLGEGHGQSTDLEWRATVVHELVHALQDQHLGLAPAMELERTTDADNAFGALVEGDATLAMLGYAAELAGVSIQTLAADPKGLAASLQIAPERLTGAMRDAPAIVREPLLFRYREGTLFAAKLYSAGGWERVDAAHRAPPQSTLSVSEPKRFLDARAELSLPLFDLEWLTAEGLRVVDEDVLGAFELATVLGEVGGERATTASAWRGDRYRVFEGPAGKTVSVWCLRFDTKHMARKLAPAFTRLADHGEARHVAHEGAYVLVVRGLDAAQLATTEKQFREWARKEP